MVTPIETTAHRFQIGNIECLVVQDRGSVMPVTQLLSDAPKEQVEALARQYGFDPQAMGFSVSLLLVNTGRHRVLIDTGLGEGELPDKLRAQGVDPASIDTIVITHGHRDHVGGIFDTAGNFVFPNARYVIGRTEYGHWTAPEQIAQAATNPAIPVWQALQDHQDRITLIDVEAGQDLEIVPGLCAINAPGHTPGHLALMIESGSGRLLHIVDAAHSVVQVTRSEWSPKFDHDKVMSVATRRKLFERAAREKALMLAYHFPFPGLGHVVAEGDALRWTEQKDG